MERDVEQYLRKGFLKRGGLCFKWTSPATGGIPDRIGFLPEGRIFIIETKAKGGRISPKQKLIHRMLAKVGVTVYVLWNKEQVDNFFKEVNV